MYPCAWFLKVLAVGSGVPWWYGTDMKRPVRKIAEKKALPRTSWGGVADRWHKGLEERADSYHASVVAPNLLRVLKPVKGMSVLDIGCGDGFVTREIAAMGADVVGTDISPEMVQLAQKAAAPNERYVAAPAEKLSFAKDASFDAATIVLALQNIEHLAVALAEAARVLRVGGRLLIVLNHPAFRIPKRTSWGWDEDATPSASSSALLRGPAIPSAVRSVRLQESLSPRRAAEARSASHGGIQYRRLDGYMSEARLAIDMEPGKGGTGKTTVSFHRPLQVYVKALTKAGFVIDGLEEWISHKKSEAGPRAKAEDTARKEFPLFLMLAARKSAAAGKVS